MRSSTLISGLATLAVVSAQSSTAFANAPVVTTNPVGAAAAVTLPNKESTPVRGSVSAVSAANGQGVTWSVTLSGLPSEGGPFLYHIHEKPVPTDGNCTGTGAHLDPYKRGETPVCDKSNKAQCQVGDLSGKYGSVNGTGFSQSYTDLYTSFDPTNPAYFANLSVVVHFANKTRITCANFTNIATGNGTFNATQLPPYPTATATGVDNSTLTISSTATGTGGAGASAGTGTATPPAAPSVSQAAAAMGMTLSWGVVLASIMGMVL